MNKRTELPTAENSSNFNRVAGATCQVGTTLENLKAAVCGETGASAKYAACAKLAKEKGYEQLDRLWEATSAAEQVHIRLEAGLRSWSRATSAPRPTPPSWRRST